MLCILNDSYGNKHIHTFIYIILIRRRGVADARQRAARMVRNFRLDIYPPPPPQMMRGGLTAHVLVTRVLLVNVHLRILRILDSASQIATVVTDRTVTSGYNYNATSEAIFDHNVIYKGMFI